MAVFAALGTAPALATSTTPTTPTATTPSTPSTPVSQAPPPPHALLESPQLWATIDVCNPADQLNTVGVRGSIPSDGHAKDELYMRFRLQYLDSTTGQWVDLGSSADSGFLAVGAAKISRQTGRSFQLVPVAGKPVTLRGVVSFQWRRGTRVEYAISRPTGHDSLAGADPKGFSAAECSLS